MVSGVSPGESLDWLQTAEVEWGFADPGAHVGATFLADASSETLGSAGLGLPLSALTLDASSGDSVLCRPGNCLSLNFLLLLCFFLSE